MDNETRQTLHSMQTAVRTAELIEITRDFTYTEWGAVLFLAKRLAKGRKEYGPLNPGDGRNWKREEAEELADSIVYRYAQLVKEIDGDATETPTYRWAPCYEDVLTWVSKHTSPRPNPSPTVVKKGALDCGTLEVSLAANWLESSYEDRNLVDCILSSIRLLEETRTKPTKGGSK